MSGMEWLKSELENVVRSCKRVEREGKIEMHRILLLMNCWWARTHADSLTFLPKKEEILPSHTCKDNNSLHNLRSFPRTRRGEGFILYFYLPSPLSASSSPSLLLFFYFRPKLTIKIGCSKIKYIYPGWVTLFSPHERREKRWCWVGRLLVCACAFLVSRETHKTASQTLKTK